jgi:small-conductance mechanosensitive channel
MRGPQYHPLTFVSFLLAVFILILPTQADIVFVTVRSGDIFTAVLLVVVTVAFVAFPLSVAQWSTRRHPDKWKPRLLGNLTWGIIAVNLAFNVTMIIYMATRAKWQ